MNKISKINLPEKFNIFNEYWSPKIVGELNGQFVKLVKFKGEFTWHSHKNEDEMFYVFKGSLKIALRDKLIELHEGEFIVIPKGVEHKPMADDEVHIMLFEPKTTEQTGGVESDLLVDQQPWI